MEAQNQSTLKTLLYFRLIFWLYHCYITNHAEFNLYKQQLESIDRGGWFDSHSIISGASIGKMWVEGERSELCRKHPASSPFCSWTGLDLKAGLHWDCPTRPGLILHCLTFLTAWQAQGELSYYCDVSIWLEQELLSRSANSECVCGCCDLWEDLSWT